MICVRWRVTKPVTSKRMSPLSAASAKIIWWHWHDIDMSTTFPAKLKPLSATFGHQLTREPPWWKSRNRPQPITRSPNILIANPLGLKLCRCIRRAWCIYMCPGGCSEFESHSHSHAHEHKRAFSPRSTCFCMDFHAISSPSAVHKTHRNEPLLRLRSSPSHCRRRYHYHPQGW